MKYLENAFASSFADQACPRFDRSWQSSEGWTDVPLEIAETYGFHDEPVFFSVRTGPQYLLLQKAMSNLGDDLYFGPSVDARVLEALVSNRISVRTAMTAGPMFVLELEAMRVTRYWRVPLASLPGNWLPSAGVCLAINAPSVDDSVTWTNGPDGTALGDIGDETAHSETVYAGEGFTVSLASGRDAALNLFAFFSSRLPKARRVRHLKRGGEYEIPFEAASVQCSEPIREGDEVAVYVEDDGRAWVRPRPEFNDGRFENR